MGKWAQMNETQRIAHSLKHGTKYANNKSAADIAAAQAYLQGDSRPAIHDEPAKQQQPAYHPPQPAQQSAGRGPMGMLNGIRGVTNSTRQPESFNIKQNVLDSLIRNPTPATPPAIQNTPAQASPPVANPFLGMNQGMNQGQTQMSIQQALQNTAGSWQDPNNNVIMRGDNDYTVGDDGRYYQVSSSWNQADNTLNREAGDAVYFHQSGGQDRQGTTLNADDTSGLLGSVSQVNGTGVHYGGNSTESDIMDWYNNFDSDIDHQNYAHDLLQDQFGTPEQYMAFLKDRQALIESGELETTWTSGGSQVLDPDNEASQALRDKYGIEQSITNDKGEVFLWDGSRYVPSIVVDNTVTGKQLTDMSMAVVGSAILGPLAAQAAAGAGLGAGLSGAVGGAVGSAAGSVSTGELDALGIASGALTGGLGGSLSDANGMLGGFIDTGSNLADDAIKGALTGALGGAFEGDVLGGALGGAASGAGMNLLEQGIGWAGDKIGGLKDDLTGPGEFDFANDVVGFEDDIFDQDLQAFEDSFDFVNSTEWDLDDEMNYDMAYDSLQEIVPGGEYREGIQFSEMNNWVTADGQVVDRNDIGFNQEIGEFTIEGTDTIVNEHANAVTIDGQVVAYKDGESWTDINGEPVTDPALVDFYTNQSTQSGDMQLIQEATHDTLQNLDGETVGYQGSDGKWYEAGSNGTVEIDPSTLGDYTRVEGTGNQILGFSDNHGGSDNPDFGGTIFGESTQTSPGNNYTATDGKGWGINTGETNYADPGATQDIYYNLDNGFYDPNATNSVETNFLPPEEMEEIEEIVEQQQPQEQDAAESDPVNNTDTSLDTGKQGGGDTGTPSENVDTAVGEVVAELQQEQLQAILDQDTSRAQEIAEEIADIISENQAETESTQETEQETEESASEVDTNSESDSTSESESESETTEESESEEEAEEESETETGSTPTNDDPSPTESEETPSQNSNNVNDVIADAIAAAGGSSTGGSTTGGDSGGGATGGGGGGGNPDGGDEASGDPAGTPGGQNTNETGDGGLTDGDGTGDGDDTGTGVQEGDGTGTGEEGEDGGDGEGDGDPGIGAGIGGMLAGLGAGMAGGKSSDRPIWTILDEITRLPGYKKATKAQQASINEGLMQAAKAARKID